MTNDISKIRLSLFDREAITRETDENAELEQNLLDKKDPEIIKDASDVDFLKIEQKLKVEKLELELEELKKDVSLKNVVLIEIRFFVKIWLVFLIIIIILDSISIHFSILDPFEIKFDISDNVLIAIVTGTTASVIGLYATIARHLFPNFKNGDKKLG